MQPVDDGHRGRDTPLNAANDALAGEAVRGGIVVVLAMRRVARAAEAQERGGDVGHRGGSVAPADLIKPKLVGGHVRELGPARRQAARQPNASGVDDVAKADVIVARRAAVVLLDTAAAAESNHVDVARAVDVLNQRSSLRVAVGARVLHVYVSGKPWWGPNPLNVDVRKRGGAVAVVVTRVLTNARNGNLVDPSDIADIDLRRGAVPAVPAADVDVADLPTNDGHRPNPVPTVAATALGAVGADAKGGRDEVGERGGVAAMPADDDFGGVGLVGVGPGGEVQGGVDSRRGEGHNQRNPHHCVPIRHSADDHAEKEYQKTEETEGIRKGTGPHGKKENSDESERGGAVD